jgi:drug/metabolite transporter (DMT)-like permease
MIISALAFTFVNASVKSLNNNFSVYQIVFFRGLGSLVFTFPFLVKHKISVLGNKRVLLFLRGVFGLISMSFFFISLKYITMGAAVCIRYTAPFFTVFFALLLLKERIKTIQWLFFAIAFSGVLLLKGFDEVLPIEGIVFATISAIFTGLAYIVIRKIGYQDHPVVVVNYFMVISTIIGGLLTINFWVTPTSLECLLLLSIGAFGYFAQLYMTKAMQIVETNQVAPLKYLEVIFTMIIGFTWFNEIYTIYSVLGILLIILGLYLNIWSKKRY